MKKIRVGIIFGGKSAEHEVSLISAKNIIDAIDKEKYETVLIGIDKKGGWHLGEQSNFLLNSGDPSLVKLNIEGAKSVALAPESSGALMSGAETAGAVDVVFPIVHGTYGEDGTLQGLLKLANVPFVGPDVLGSAVGMDKDVMKRLLREAGIPIGKFQVVRKGESVVFDDMVKKLDLPIFIKPANMGSSVGVHKVENETEFQVALDDAFQFDTKVIVEEFIKGREIECAILGTTENPEASIPGEVKATHDFYSYDAKYIDPNGADIIVPADLPAEIIAKVQEIAKKTFQVLECYGLARVDVFVTLENKVVVNEINTLPGFTSISMYPKLWEASGLSYPDLIDKLIQLALERFEQEKRKKVSYN